MMFGWRPDLGDAGLPSGLYLIFPEYYMRPEAGYDSTDLTYGV